MNVVSQSSRLTLRASPLTPQERLFSVLHPARLVTPRRWDIAVKTRYFRHLLHRGGDLDADRLYCWHIEERSGHRFRAGLVTDGHKKSVGHYIAGAWRLFHLMSLEGFRSEFAIPVDPDGEILGGAHRIACALALGLTEIPVEHRPNRVWADAWDEAWFVRHGCPAEDLDRIRKDWQSLHDEAL